MRDNSINIVNVPIGPGSQSEGDMVLDYMKMPSEMNTYDMPSFPEESELERCPKAMSILADIQLMLGQNQAIIHKAETPIMKINQYMTSNPVGLKSTEALCNYIKIDSPQQEIRRSNLTLIYKIVEIIKYSNL